MLVGCGESQQSAPSPEAKPVDPVVEAENPIYPKANKTLLNAVKKEDVEVAKQAITDGADLNGQTDYNLKGRTPLHVVILKDNIEIAAILISNGANLNAKDEWGTTPIHIAAGRGNLELVKLLVKKGANIETKRDNGDSLLHIASALA